MQRKALPTLLAFAVCAVALSLGLLIRFTLKNAQEKEAQGAGRGRAQARVSVTGDGAESALQGSYAGALGSSGVQVSFDLEEDETLIQAVNADINIDGTYDQVCAVRRGAEAELYIVCAIQDPLTTAYTRLAPVKTGVTQARTLLMYFTDVTGRHESALVYSGMNAQNMQALGIFLLEEDAASPAGFALKEILNVTADGSIQLEQARRTEAYNLGMAAGASFPVVSYHSIPGEEGSNPYEQIRRTYRWNPASGVYELAAEARVSAETTGAVIAQRLRGEGDDGLYKFLKGVWQKSGASVQVAFDLASGEVIFADGQTQEVFASESFSARRYGAYLVARNNLISSIRRLIDIEIAGPDELRLRASDDVRLRIEVDSPWNGTYRRVKSEAARESSGGSAERIAGILEGSSAGWTASSGTAYSFADGILVTESADGIREESKYAIYMMRGSPVMQVRGAAGESAFYLLREEADGRIALQEAVALATELKSANTPEITLEAVQQEASASGA